jgi:hypothetical protein
VNVAQGERWISRDRHTTRVIVTIYPGRFPDERIIKRPGEQMQPISEIDLLDAYEPLEEE